MTPFRHLEECMGTVFVFQGRTDVPNIDEILKLACAKLHEADEIFSLYKFRYMYWKYCTKEDYNINDNALRYEEELKKEKNTRE